MMRRPFPAVLALLLVLAPMLSATQREAAPAEDQVSKTSHTMRLGGRELAYTATAGTLPVRLDDGKVSARMFFVAYTKDGEDTTTRPIAFLYNGGPGSASVWLHMGSFAPKKAQMADDGFQPAPPVRAGATTRTRCSTSPTWCSSTPSAPASAASPRAPTPRSSMARTATSARSASSSPNT